MGSLEIVFMVVFTGVASFSFGVLVGILMADY